MLGHQASCGSGGLAVEVAEDTDVVGDGYWMAESDLRVGGAADTNLGTNLTLRDVQVLGSLVQKVAEGLQVFV